MSGVCALLIRGYGQNVPPCTSQWSGFYVRLGQKQTFRAVNCDVCFTSSSDIHSCERHARFGPKADSCTAANCISIRPPRRHAFCLAGRTVRFLRASRATEYLRRSAQSDFAFCIGPHVCILTRQAHQLGGVFAKLERSVCHSSKCPNWEDHANAV